MAYESCQVPDLKLFSRKIGYCTFPKKNGKKRPNYESKAKNKDSDFYHPKKPLNSHPLKKVLKHKDFFFNMFSIVTIVFDLRSNAVLDKEK